MRQSRMSKWGARYAIVLAAVVMPWAAHAASDAQSQLQAFAAHVSSATGTFSQTTAGTDGRVQPAQTGTFAFSRPGKFRWSVQKPYAQLVISNGTQIYQYDPDLQQLTVREAGQAIGASPAAVLFGSQPLDQVFNVSPLPDHDGLQWLRLKPRQANAGFAQLDIGMKGDMPAQIDLVDTFGGHTRIVLSGMQVDAKLPPSTYQFTPPQGTVVVHM